MNGYSQVAQLQNQRAREEPHTMSKKQQAKEKGGKVGLMGIAMMLIAQGQQALTSGNQKIGAGMLLAGAVLLLGYEYLNDKTSKDDRF